MTTRDEINIQFRKVKKLVLAGFVVFFGGGFSGLLFTFLMKNESLLPVFIFIGLCGWALAAFGFLKLWFTFKCPKCNGRFWILQMGPTGSWWQLKIASDYKFCVYCGINFDLK